ncbi:hypothetical protein GS506_04425 [Rhodococcus hoagii]|nr:hypothetical protein [Prescottella equi]
MFVTNMFVLGGVFALWFGELEQKPVDHDRHVRPASCPAARRGTSRSALVGASRCMFTIASSGRNS